MMMTIEFFVLAAAIKMSSPPESKCSGVINLSSSRFHASLISREGVPEYARQEIRPQRVARAYPGMGRVCCKKMTGCMGLQ